MIRRAILLGCLSLSSACGQRDDATAPLAGVAGHDSCVTPGLAQRAPSTSGMVHVGGGDFLMGAEPMHAEEGPPRAARVKSFFIDATEVTNRDFARFVAATGHVTLAERPLDPRRYPGLPPQQLKPSSLVFVGADDPRAGPMQWWAVIPGADWRHPDGPGSSIEGRDAWPVVQVGWDDAKAYADWLGRDLPTEAEWEYAALGGEEGNSDGAVRANIWEGLFPLNDSGADGYKARTAPVGCFPSGGYGLHDMAGNVWEWTADWYAPGLDPADAAASGPEQALAFDPDDPGVAKRVIKGGSYLCADNYCLRYRPPARQAGPPDTGSSHIGFRTVLREERQPPDTP
ncbi:MAG: formylglycine-generating enzyme family protein [Alphaproteobacteria bacterium]|nr:formylglycine-generating enzyme family protein [Alphaproteobacteria bacterium]